MIVDCVFHLHRYLFDIYFKKTFTKIFSNCFTIFNYSSDYQINCIFVHFISFLSFHNYWEAAILKISASVFSSCGVITARHDVILNQSEHIRFYNHLSNHTKFVCFVFKFGENSSIPMFEQVSAVLF